MLTKDNLIAAFGRLDVTPEYLERKLEHSLDSLTDAEVYELNLMYNAAVRCAKARARDEIRQWHLREYIVDSRYKD